MDTPTGSETIVGTDTALTSPDAPSPTLCVRVVASPDAMAVGRTVAITGRGVVLGRSENGPAQSDQIRLADGRMSRGHARLVRPAPDAPVRLEDLGSKNGTLVNRCRVKRVELSPGDILRTGDSLFVLCPPVLEIPDIEGGKTGLVGVSAVMREARNRIHSMADADMAVLVLGETGTGKEVVANALHRLSSREGPLVPLNASAIPKDLFESELFGAREGAYSGAKRSRKGYLMEAHRGTLFLDEIGEMPHDVQSKLLRTLETGEVTPLGATQGTKVDVRVVSATNADIDADATGGRFRLDLLFRLAQLRVALPPLRVRREDIPILWDHFTDFPFADIAEAAAQEALLCHAWLGNVRELRNVARGLTIEARSGPVTLHHLPDAISAPYLAARTNQQPNHELRTTAAKGRLPPGGRPTREDLIAAISAEAGNLAAVARWFNRQRPQIYRWLKRYEIDVDEVLKS